MRSARGTLFVVSAPSGAGKTTLCGELLKTIENLKFAVSYTTRPPREGEVDGRDYHFLIKEEFLAMKDKGEFAEWAEVHGNLYGTSRADLDALLQGGSDVLHDIDVQGARQMRDVYPDAVYVFVLPPSLDALRERLKRRDTDTEEIISRRLAVATGEISEYLYYNYVILNDTLDMAVRDFSSIIASSRLTIDRIDRSWVERNFLTQEE